MPRERWENKNNSISELTIKNNLNISQTASWTFNTGVQNVSNQTILNASEFILVYVASNYSSSGIYITNASVSSLGLLCSDSETGMILT